MNPDESLELDLELDNENINNRAENRIKDLSSKVKEKAQLAEENAAKAEEADARATAAEKKAEFLESFSQVSAKHPNASEYKDAIQEKVFAGYTVEDAAVAVLAAEGKYSPPAGEVVAPIAAAGGSASNPPLQGAEKPLDEMSREEKRAQLMAAEQSGELSKILQRGL
jgi:hypothetical protein